MADESLDTFLNNFYATPAVPGDAPFRGSVKDFYDSFNRYQGVEPPALSSKPATKKGPPVKPKSGYNPNLSPFDPANAGKTNYTVVPAITVDTPKPKSWWSGFYENVKVVVPQALIDANKPKTGLATVVDYVEPASPDDRVTARNRAAAKQTPLDIIPGMDDNAPFPIDNSIPLNLPQTPLPVETRPNVIVTGAQAIMQAFTPKPAPPLEFQSAGYIYETQTNGVAVRTGKKAKGYEGLNASQTYDAVNANAKASAIGRAKSPSKASARASLASRWGFE